LRFERPLRLLQQHYPKLDPGVFGEVPEQIVLIAHRLAAIEEVGGGIVRREYDEGVPLPDVLEVPGERRSELGGRGARLALESAPERGGDASPQAGRIRAVTGMRRTDFIDYSCP